MICGIDYRCYELRPQTQVDAERRIGARGSLFCGKSLGTHLEVGEGGGPIPPPRSQL